MYRISVLLLQQFGPILDVEIIFNERGSKVCTIPYQHTYYIPFCLSKKNMITVNDTCRASYVAIKKREYRACTVFCFCWRHTYTRARWTLAYIVVSLCDNTWNTKSEPVILLLGVFACGRKSLKKLESFCESLIMVCWNQYKKTSEGVVLLLILRIFCVTYNCKSA